MLEILLGSAGGIFGIVGALFKHGLEVYQTTKKEEQSLLVLKETNAHELAMADKQAALMKLEAANAIKLADITSTSQIEQAAYNALEASYESDKATFSNAPQSSWMIAVDACRGFIRPGLTFIFSAALIITTVILFFQVPEATAGKEDFLKPTFYKLIDALIFLATSSVGWYFAARPSTKQKD